MLRDAFKMTNEALCNTPGLDVRFSGSTCVSVLTFSKKIYVANVGDSRAILIRQGKQQNQFEVAALTRDHKPCDPLEGQRIITSGGRVDSYRDAHGNKVGPDRVWVKDEDLPGLAMSRSFGDMVACTVGVNAIPECREVTLCAEDKVIVLASDGVWEFMSNEEVANVVYPFYLQRNAEKAAETLVRTAFKRWKGQETYSVDDITCIVVFIEAK